MEPFLYRCVCCGEWLWMFRKDWNPKIPNYCETCSYERSGDGRGKCEYCKLYPKGCWDDPKPKMPFISVCVR